MRPQKKISVKLVGQASEAYEKLQNIVKEQEKKGKTNSEEKQLLKSIDKKAETLKYNPAYGQNIPKDQIPANLAVNNLFRLELTNYWRMLYTIKTNEIEIVSFILLILDHPSYDKLFGYRKR